jgi:hypothetical protein
MEQPTAPQSSLGDARAIELLKHARQFRSGANWFYWIAGFSLINSIVSLTKGNWNFLIGLGSTQILDAIAAAFAKDAAAATATIIKAFSFGLDIMVALLFVLVGWLANKRRGWAFLVGMFLYLLDGILFVFVQEWKSVAFHVFALVCIFTGYAALRKIRELEASMATSVAVAGGM